MHIDSTELSRVAAAAGQRFDIYTVIHKALRARMADTLLAVGRMDPLDAADRTQVTERVLQLLAVCAGHVEHENRFVHAAIEARAPGASEAIAHEHEEHLRHIALLVDAATRLRAGGDDAQRLATAATLYRELALFIADNLRHMHVEETAHNALLWARYTDAELLAIHDALVASIPPAEMMDMARWMVPFINPAERHMMLDDMRSKAPPPAFQAVLDVARPHLEPAEWTKLERALALPAA